MQDVATEESRDTETLRIGILGFGAADRWPALRGAVAAQQPGLRLHYRDLDLVDQYDAIRLGEVDVALLQFVGDVDGVEFEAVLTSPRVAVVPAASEQGDASHLTADDLTRVGRLGVGSPEPLVQAWMGAASDSGGPTVRHPAAIPTAVATTGRVSVHAAAAARYYPHPDVRFVPLEGDPVQVAVATRSGITARRRRPSAGRRPSGHTRWLTGRSQPFRSMIPPGVGGALVAMATQRTQVCGGHVLSMDRSIGELPTGDVLVEDGVITAVAPSLANWSVLTPCGLPAS